MAEKRKAAKRAETNTELPMCKYGEKCYRKNPEHLKKFRHTEDIESKPPKKAKIEDFFQDESSKDKKEPESETVDKTSKSQASEAGNASGYVREESDTEDAPQDSEPSQPGDKQTDVGDVRESIKQKFLVEMPEDFYDFWELCKTIDSKKPRDAFKQCGLHLVGPFDVLAGEGHRTSKTGNTPCYLRHWRYYYDPPEFMTVLRGDDKTQYHMGYFRDDPKEMPVFMAANSAKENCTITPKGENIFAAVKLHIDDKIKKEKTNKEKLKSIQEQLIAFAEEKGYSLDAKTKNMKARDKKVVCKTFHGAGIVVPVDENEVGYRPVPETPADLKRMFKKIADSKTESERDKNAEDLQELITLVQFANDECDYGEGLELGIDLFCYGEDSFHSYIMHLLPIAYQLLGRPEYAEIIQAHLENRKHTTDLSEID